MAAPKTIYSTQDIKMTSGTTSHRLCRMPKARTAYGNDAGVMSKFYVDRVFHTKDKNGVDCIIGCVTENSNNSKMHAAKRLGHLRITSGGSGTYIVLTDGGMNTLGKSDITTAYKGATNYVFYGGTTNAAYYLSGKTTLDYWTGSGTHTLVDNVLTHNSGITTSYTKSTPIVASTATSYNFMLSHVNSEGRYSGATLTAPVRGACKMITVRAVSSISDNYTTGTSYNVLIFEDYYQTLASSTQNSGHYEYPNLKNLFATATSSTLTTNSLLNTGATTNISNLTWNAHLPQGMYYGVPTTYTGTDYKIVYVNANGYPYKWATSTYNPMPSTFTVTVWCSVSDELGSNIGSIYVVLEGYNSTIFNKQMYQYIQAGGTYVTNVAQANLQSVFVVFQTSNLTWPPSYGNLVNMTVSESYTGAFQQIELDSYDPQDFTIELGDLREIREGSDIYLDFSIELTQGH